MKGLFVQTYGCQMNVSDSDRMKAILAPLGYEDVKTPNLADLVLINTCSIREKAENKTSSFAFDLQSYKKANPRLKIGVTGCVAQQEKEAILKKLPFVDLVLGPDNIDELPWILEDIEKRKSENRKTRGVVRAEFDSSSAREWKTTTQVLNPGPTAFISVMKGCDHFCSYCIVPYTRGREKSRPISDVVADVRDLVAKGVKEVTFLGQNINTYGKRAGESLAELFKRTHEIEGLHRIRFTTSHPGDLKDDLIQCFKELPKLSSQFHLPVQSGSNSVLRSMRRFYTREQYLERAQALREARPDIALSTDIIVGFPGESDDDFEQTLSLLTQVRYDNVYSFIYSARPGTSAAARPNDVPQTTSAQRLLRLQTEARRISKELHVAEIGRVHDVLIEGISKKDATKLTGRTSQNVPVHLPNSPELKVGDFVRVKILDGSLTHLTADHPIHI